MSDSSSVPERKSFIQRPMPAWLAAIIVGIALGGGVTYQVMRAVGYDLPDPNKNNGPPADMQAMMSRMGGGGAGMMGGGGGGMGGMMGGGGARGKRSLTALVGKLDLLSKGLHIDIGTEQAEKIAAKLADLDHTKQMTDDEAQKHLDAIQEVLTEEQQATVAAIELPRGRSGGRGMGGMMAGMGGAGGPPPGSGAMPPGGGGGGGPAGMMGGGGPPSDENPFRQETNQKRLHDLLNRLQPSPIETPETTGSADPTDDEEKAPAQP
ncbi:MAG TPA: hypothetical protein VMV69_13435 [Pirellulales bacterium]|nr:hypothetical protein [Pirellulales bacterium]